MAAGLLVVSALVLGLAPVGEPLEPLAPLAPADSFETTPQASVGPVSVDSSGVAVATDLPLPTDLETGVSLCATCPGLTLAAGQGATAQAAPASPAPSSKNEGAMAIIRDAPPEAVVAGSSLLATALAALAWFGRAALAAGLAHALGLFSRIDDGALASHPLRRQALDYIATNPGAGIQDIRRGLGIAWGTAVYHLGRLERAGLVAVRSIGGRRGHWPLGQAPARDALAATGQALARLVRERPGLAQNQLARLAGIGAPAACKQLRRLESAGFIEAEWAGRARHYRPTQRLEALMVSAGGRLAMAS
jgi:DNA-binding MarR family transcriptional regulator